jgi:hypothetical protein
MQAGNPGTGNEAGDEALQLDPDAVWVIEPEDDADDLEIDRIVERERMARRRFLEVRQASGIGSSELLGTPDRDGNIERPGLFDGGALDVYHAHTRPITDEDVDSGRDSIDLLRGNLQEPIAVAYYFRTTGRRGRRVKAPATHPDYPGTSCSRDAIIFADEKREVWKRGTAPLEVKNPRSGGFHRLFEQGTSPAIVLQLQYQSAVTRSTWGSFAFCNLEHSAGPIIPVDIEADPVVGEWLLVNVSRFWVEHVVPRIPPDPAEWAQLLDKAPPVRTAPTSSKLITLDPVGHADAVELAARLFELGALFKSAEEAKEEIQQRLDGWLRERFPAYSKFEIDQLGKITRIASKGRVTFDADALREHRPIDRDAFVRFLREFHEDDVDGRTFDDASIEELADSLALDVGRFNRQGAPYEYLRTYPAKP